MRGGGGTAVFSSFNDVSASDARLPCAQITSIWRTKPTRNIIWPHITKGNPMSQSSLRLWENDPPISTAPQVIVARPVQSRNHCNHVVRRCCLVGLGLSCGRSSVPVSTTSIRCQSSSVAIVGGRSCILRIYLGVKGWFARLRSSSKTIRDAGEPSRCFQRRPYGLHSPRRRMAFGGFVAR